MAPSHSDLEQSGFGKRLDDERLMLAPVELLYLMGKGILTLKKGLIPSTRRNIFHLQVKPTKNLPGKIRYIPSSGRMISLPGQDTSLVIISGSTAGRISILICLFMPSKRRPRSR